MLSSYRSSRSLQQIAAWTVILSLSIILSAICSWVYWFSSLLTHAQMPSQKPSPQLTWWTPKIGTTMMKPRSTFMIPCCVMPTERSSGNSTMQPCKQETSLNPLHVKQFTSLIREIARSSSPLKHLPVSLHRSCKSSSFISWTEKVCMVKTVTSWESQLSSHLDTGPCTDTTC